jgi:nicotinamidase-related amidase
MNHIQEGWGPFVLLLIDLQRDFWSKEVSGGFPQFPANIAQLLNFCRTEGIDIIHLRARFMPDGSDWMPRYRLLGRIPCISGTDGVKVLPFAFDKPGEPVIVKQTFDGFHNPQLLDYLLREGKRFVLTAGLVTSVCVFLTTASAAQQGFLTAVVEDCCADRPQNHKQTLETYQFIFERTDVAGIPGRHLEWLAALKELDRLRLAEA